jgi:DNA polymerase III alpha subunit
VMTLLGFPRHLSQHTGGFVIAGSHKLSRLVPIEPAAMENRRVIQWDKDDLESLGLLKVDVLALGMLTAMRKTFDLLQGWNGQRWTMRDIPWEDPATYAMAQRADTIGVFQIESRAQQSMLPRLKPSTFYDLVVEVAIVRPGPIQGGMVHPYLRRKMGHEPVAFPAGLKDALNRTLGVPIFQEQVMQVCMTAAGFSAGEADNLRRAMAAWRRKGGVDQFKERVIEGMVDNGYERPFAESIFRQIEGFGEYGFPESHAYGFALIAYFSAWLKCHHPAASTAGLLNSQPMGFYAPSQLVQDVRRHGVEVRHPDVMHSDWDCTLEPDARGQPALRLGLRMIKGLAQTSAERLVAARAQQPFDTLHDLTVRAQLDSRDLQTLARAEALRALAGHRREQVWATAPDTAHRHSLLHAAPIHETQLSLLEAPEGEAIVQDHASMALSLRRHPLALLRLRLARRGMLSAEELSRQPHNRHVWACGLVIGRQQPGTAKGTIFVTLEDETGPLNVIVWKSVREAHRAALLTSRLLAVGGTWQHKDGVSHLVARELVDLSGWLGGLAEVTSSRDFH